MDDLDVKHQTTVSFVDTNIIPDRNAGIGSLLWDLQSPQESEWGGSPLLNPEFAFIDVGVSRAKVATALKTLLASDLGMNVIYVATERPEAVPYAHVILRGDRAEKIRSYLSAMCPSNATSHEVKDWHYVVNREGKVSAVAYSYKLYGNDVWESYFMGQPFLYAGDEIDFSDLKLNELLATDLQSIESMIDLKRNGDNAPGQTELSWDRYKIEKSPLQSGLESFGIALQKTDVPQRIKDRQNVLFLGNILNHYPQDARGFELDRIASNMEEGDIVIVQIDGIESPTIEVLGVKGQGCQKMHERLRWINTKTLELQKPAGDPESWQQINLKPCVDRMVFRVIECLVRSLNSAEWNQRDHRLLMQYVSHVFLTHFRAMPVDEVLRIAIRDALRRLSFKGIWNGTPVFQDDLTDAYGRALGASRNPIVSVADFANMKLAVESVERTAMSEETAASTRGFWNRHEQSLKN